MAHSPRIGPKTGPKAGWIRTPLFDSIWVLSGPPLGLLLLGFSAFLHPALLRHACILLFQSGHLWAPILLAWSHRDFRKLMLASKAKYIFVPLAILIASTAIGYSVGLHLELAPGATEDELLRNLVLHPYGTNRPLVLLLELYLIWNCYHFAAQDFGILSLYRNKSANHYPPHQRLMDQAFCYFVGALGFPPILMRLLDISLASNRDEDILWKACGILIALAATVFMGYREIQSGSASTKPRLIYIASKGITPVLAILNPLIGFAAYSLNHWTVSIGLSSHIFSVNQTRTAESPKWYRSWGAFAGGMVLLSAAYFVFLVFISGQASKFDLRTLTFHLTATAFASRMGLGLVHFLYDRYLFKFSRKEVRDTIGRDLTWPVPAPSVSHQDVLQKSA